MTDSPVLPQRNFWRPVLIATLIFLAVGLTAGGVEDNAFSRGIEAIKIENGLIEIKLAK